MASLEVRGLSVLSFSASVEQVRRIKRTGEFVKQGDMNQSHDRGFVAATPHLSPWKRVAEGEVLRDFTRSRRPGASAMV